MLNFHNPNPDDLIETLQTLFDTAIANPNRKVTHSLCTISDREAELMKDNINALKNAIEIQQVKTRNKIGTNAISFELIPIRMFTKLQSHDDENPFESGNSFGEEQWCYEIMINAIWKKTYE